MNVVSVEVPTPMLLASNQRLHWATKASRTRWLRMHAASMWAREGRPAHERAQITVVVDYPDRRRRDVHNLMPTVKACIDGMVAAGLLPDDDDTHLAGPDLRPSGEVRGPGRYCFHFQIQGES